MSSHFSANQYESAFASQRLQNYQIPTKYKEHPSLRKGATKIIVNDRGHLNPDMNRSTSSPWGSFVGTWQTERKPIQLQTRSKLTAHLYYTASPVPVMGSRTLSAREGTINKEKNSLGSQPSTPLNGSRPNTSDSNSSWVVIDNLPSNLRTPTPTTPLQSPSIRSPSVMLPIDEVGITQIRSPTCSQQTASRQQSQMSCASGNQSPLGLKPSLTSPQNKLQTSVLSPHLTSQLEQEI